MALSLDANQQTLIASDKLRMYWLFDVSDGIYFWSTKYVASSIYNSQEYTFKVIPETFSGIRLSRPRAEMGIQAPNELSFSIENKDNVFTASTFDGDTITVHLVLSDGTLTEKIASWSFKVTRCEDLYQRLEFTCEDILQQYLEGDYPNTPLVSSLAPSDVTESEDNMCAPLTFGTAYIPTRPIYISDARYYLLGELKPVVDDDLSGHWPMVTSVGFSDLSSEGNDGTNSNSTLGDDYTEFNGTTSMVNLGADVIGTGDISISFWMYSQGAGEQADEVIIGNNKAGVWWNDSGDLVAHRRGNPGGNVAYSATSSVPNDTWAHVVVTSTSAGVANIYIDGVLSGSANQSCETPEAGTTNTVIGAWSTAADYCFDGYLKDLRLYDRILTFAEISEISSRAFTPNFDIQEVASPVDFPISKWGSDSYTFTESLKRIDGVSYQVYQPIISDSDSDGTEDACGIWMSGGVIQDCRTSFSRGDTSAITGPEEVIEYVVEDMGVSSLLLDTGSGGSFESAGSTYTSWGLDFQGGFFYKQANPTVLSSLLVQSHSTLRVTDKIELHPLSKTSQATVDKTLVKRGTFKYDLLTPTTMDCGYVAYAPSGEPEDELVKILVPAKSTTDDISTEVLQLPFIHDSQEAQKIGNLYYQRKLLKYANVSFVGLPELLDVQPDDVITINDTEYGGTYQVLVDSMTIKPNLTIQFNCIRFSSGLDDWTDLSPSVVTPAIDDTTSIWTSTITGPDSTVDEGVAPNVMQGRLRVGTTGNYIMIDPADPLITLYEGGNARVKIGDLSVDNYGIEIYNAASELIFKSDGSASSMSGWSAGVDSLSNGNAVLHSDGYVSFGTTPPTAYGNNIGAYMGFETPYAKMSLYSDANNYLQWDGTKLLIKATNFALDSSGNLTATNVDLTGTITATGGTFGGWHLDTDRLYNDTSGYRIELDSGDGRISIFADDSSGGDSAKVIMGFLDGKLRNGASGTATTGTDSTTLVDDTKQWERSITTDSSGADSSGSINEGGMVGLYLHYTSGPADGESKIILWNEEDTIKTGAFTGTPVAGNTYEVRYGSNDYGFWAAQGDSLWIDGNVSYKSGDWIIHHDSSYQVLNSEGTTIVKIGRDEVQVSGIFDTGQAVIIDTTGTGIPDTQGGGGVGTITSGLFIYNDGGDQISRFHAGGFRVGGATNAENYMEYDAVTGVLAMNSNSPNAIYVGSGGDISLINTATNPAKVRFAGDGYAVEFFGSNYSAGFKILPDLDEEQPTPRIIIGNYYNQFSSVELHSQRSTKLFTANDPVNEDRSYTTVNTYSSSTLNFIAMSVSEPGSHSTDSGERPIRSFQVYWYNDDDYYEFACPTEDLRIRDAGEGDSSDPADAWIEYEINGTTYYGALTLTK